MSAQDQSKENINCKVVIGDNRTVLNDYVGQADLILTSPPYADARQKQYGGVHPDEYAHWFTSFHTPFFKALKPTGSLVINIKGRVINGVRHRYVWKTIEKLSDLGWMCIDDYVWAKQNSMPGYWPTRFSDAWEYCFHLAKQKRPYFDRDAVKKPIGEWAKTRMNNLSQDDRYRRDSSNDSGFGRNASNWAGREFVNPNNVIYSPVVGSNKGHPAVFPTNIPKFFIKLLCPVGGLVIDPFAGSGTTGVAAISLGRRCLLIEKEDKYRDVIIERLSNETPVCPVVDGDTTTIKKYGQMRLI